MIKAERGDTILEIFVKINKVVHCKQFVYKVKFAHAQAMAVKPTGHSSGVGLCNKGLAAKPAHRGCLSVFSE